MTERKHMAANIAGLITGSREFVLFGASAYVIPADGRRIHLPEAALENSAVDREGRETYARYMYADGSRLVVRWHEGRGASLEVTPPKDYTA